MEGWYDNCFIRVILSLEVYLWFEFLIVSVVLCIFKWLINNNVEKIYIREVIVFDRLGNLFL